MYCPKLDDRDLRPSLYGPLHWIGIPKKDLPYETWAVVRRVFSYADEQYFTGVREEYSSSDSKAKVDDHHFLLFTDASPAGWGVVELSPKRISCFSAPFRVGRDGGVPPFSIKPSIEYNELVGAIHGIVHTIATSSAKSITVFIDNLEVAKRIIYWQNKSRWQCSTMKPPSESELIEEQAGLLKEEHTTPLVEAVMDNIIHQLLERLRMSKVALKVCWVPGYMNLADAPSRGYIRNFQYTLSGELSESPAIAAPKKSEKRNKKKEKSVKAGKKKAPKVNKIEKPSRKLRSPQALDLDALGEEKMGNDMFADFYKQPF